MRVGGITHVSYKKHKSKMVLKIVIFLVLIAFIITAALSSYIAWNILHPEKESIKPFSSNIVPDYTNISIPGKDKSILLSGWFFKKKDSSRTVILAHDYGKNRLQFEESTIHMVKEFLNKGYNVLAFDFRNSGKSGGSATTIGALEKDDLLAVINYTTKFHGSKNIVLMGFSTGATACILAASRAENVDAIIADSPFTELDDYVNYRAQKWDLPSAPFTFTIPLAVKLLGNIENDDVNPRKIIKELTPRPILLIHGKDDASISVSSSRELFAIYSKASDGNAELWEVENAGHLEGYKKDQDAYMSHVFKFLDKVYKG